MQPSESFAKGHRVSILHVRGGKTKYFTACDGVDGLKAAVSDMATFIAAAVDGEHDQ